LKKKLLQVLFWTTILGAGAIAYSRELEGMIEVIHQQQEILKRLDRIEERLGALGAKHQVTLTAYSARPEETDNTPWETACLTRPTPGTVAVSRDLEARGWTCGKRVWVAGYGLLVVNDRMHKRKRNQLDLFFESTERALVFGIQPGRQAALLEM